jgi:transcriptional regulator with XRE-family HTH domain
MEVMAPPTPFPGLAVALRAARKARGLTQEDFSQVSSRTYMSSLERGLKSPTFEKLTALAQALDIHPLTLMTLAFMQGKHGESLRALQARVQREIESLEMT